MENLSPARRLDQLVRAKQSPLTKGPLPILWTESSAANTSARKAHCGWGTTIDARFTGNMEKKSNGSEEGYQAAGVELAHIRACGTVVG